ncbi:uncharacterized protein BXZ73DRAFT_100815 [Epithele typhae]|uniref:uncharacterized protein n=1 Tax=Epithele typhae TaxID=378194 RepID=UPI002007CD76|nr:uncharacterized protein BXZ73DRAFT_100815 [Epithele typhae]KAH9933978.1 hypothetical protein BXZ73DRAFT_100815 [Epithele typhae]
MLSINLLLVAWAIAATFVVWWQPRSYRRAERAKLACYLLNLKLRMNERQTRQGFYTGRTHQLVPVSEGADLLKEGIVGVYLSDGEVATFLRNPRLQEFLLRMYNSDSMRLDEMIRDYHLRELEDSGNDDGGVASGRF